MNILICNDDGIEASGIVKLAEIANLFGDVYVVAPSGQRSATSHGITSHEDMIVRVVEFPVPVKVAFSVDGTPADCARLGVTCLLPVQPDIIFSGINRGYNLGFDTIYSGTVGAAREGLRRGLKAIAVSMYHDEDYSIIDAYLKDVLETILKEDISSNEIWNINTPHRKVEDVKGIKYTSLAPYSYFEHSFVKEQIGENEFRVYTARANRDEFEKGSDIEAIEDGYISVSKIRGLYY